MSIPPDVVYAVKLISWIKGVFGQKKIFRGNY